MTGGGGVVGAGPVATSKLLDSRQSYIEGNSILKACWGLMCLMPYGEWWCKSMLMIYPLLAI